MTDGKIFFNQPVRNDSKKYDNVQKITNDPGDDYTIRYLLDHPHFKEFYKLVAINLSKQHTLDVDPKVIQQINVAVNLERDKNKNLIIEETKKKHSKFVKRKFVVILTLFCFNIILI